MTFLSYRNIISDLLKFGKEKEPLPEGRGSFFRNIEPKPNYWRSERTAELFWFACASMDCAAWSSTLFFV